MPYYQGVQIGTVNSTILQTPPNYSFVMRSLYVGNSATVTDYDQLSLYAYTTSGGTVSGTVNLGYFPQSNGSQSFNSDDTQMLVPASSYLVGVSKFGNVTLTYGGTYIYYRE